jgi:hypothetical protein
VLSVFREKQHYHGLLIAVLYRLLHHCPAPDYLQLHRSPSHCLSTVPTGAGAGPVDVDRKATEDLAAMSNDRRQIVEALTEERAGLVCLAAL